MQHASPPSSFRQQLLPTSRESLPAGIETAARKLCSETAGVESAFLCWVSEEVDGCDPETRLHLAVKLSLPVRSPADIAGSAATPIRTGLARDAALIGQVRLALLADRAVNAWRARGVEVYRASA